MERPTAAGPAWGRVAMDEATVEPTTKQASAWLAFLEQQIQLRPKICLGAALTLGLTLAWLVKRK